MAKPRYKPEQIIAHLRHEAVLTGQGKTMNEALRALGVTGKTYCGVRALRWKGDGVTGRFTDSTAGTYLAVSGLVARSARNAAPLSRIRSNGETM